MRIPYSTVYALLDRHYLRGSLSAIVENIPTNIFNASLMFASQFEDYDYLAVMQRDMIVISEEYSIFTHINNTQPIILKVDKDLTVLEFAELCISTEIERAHFHHMIEAHSENIGIDKTKFIEKFDNHIDHIHAGIIAENSTSGDINS